MPSSDTSSKAPAGAPTSSTSLAAAKPQRVLACVRCQQRKVKCDRVFPCTNCVRTQTQCIPATTLGPRQRRRRFPERELLDRLRHYEDLLRQHRVSFEPMHQASPQVKIEATSIDDEGSREGSPTFTQPPTSVSGADEASSPPSTANPSQRAYRPHNLWHAMNLWPQNSDDDSSDYSTPELHERRVKDAYNHAHPSNDHLLFGIRHEGVELSSLHPDQGNIFKLWQIYLDNVSPLLKITHTPTLQARIIDAAGDLSSASSILSALMFSIYSAAVQSLADNECEALLATSKDVALTKYQFGCQQALLDCGFLQSNDRECLTALFLYLVSARSNTASQSLSSMLGLAIRIAQRIGLHSEATNEKCNPFETEMRRRLWWAIQLFDWRICELSDGKAVTLIPTWDCKPPSNVSDFDMQPDMKNTPVPREGATEAIFTVVRSQMGDFVRNASFHLDFVNPALKGIARNVMLGAEPGAGEAITLEKMLEDRYLKFCDPENPLYFATLWLVRSYLAKHHIIEFYAFSVRSSAPPTSAQRIQAGGQALKMLESDTKLLSSPLTKRYGWLTAMHFPFPAYHHILQNLRRHPEEDLGDRTWDIMSDNWDLRCEFLGGTFQPFFQLFAKVTLEAWQACEAALGPAGRLPPLPRIVKNIQEQMAPKTEAKGSDQALDMNIDDFINTLPANTGSRDVIDIDIEGFLDPRSGSFPAFQVQPWFEVENTAMPWNSMDWDPFSGRGWP